MLTTSVPSRGSVRLGLHETASQRIERPSIKPGFHFWREAFGGTTESNVSCLRSTEPHVATPSNPSAGDKFVEAPPAAICKCQRSINLQVWLVRSSVRSHGIRCLIGRSSDIGTGKAAGERLGLGGRTGPVLDSCHFLAGTAVA